MALLATPSRGQRHAIYTDRIATLQVVAGNDWLSPPVTYLKGGTPINISFDDLTHEYTRYTYKVEHCEADWTTSEDLFTSDYIDGFTEGNLIEDTEESLNTNVLYTHYRLTIPNDRCRLKMSGNYRVTVYDDNNDEEPVLSACFMVVEPRMSVKLNVSSNTDIDVDKSHQQVGMEVSLNGVNVTDPSRQVQTVVLQNGRWDNCVVNASPQYTTSSMLRWDHNRTLIFNAVNEYHKFEVLDTDHPTLGIDKMRWDGSRFLSQSGFFLLEQQGEGAWVLEPDASPLEFSGNYRQGEESFSYHVLLRPWGQEWSGEQRLPFRYNDWYLPLIGSGEAMPERIG